MEEIEIDKPLPNNLRNLQLEHFNYIKNVISEFGYYPISNNQIHYFIFQAAQFIQKANNKYIYNLDFLLSSSFKYSLKLFEKHLSIQFILILMYLININNDSITLNSSFLLLKRLIMKLYQEDYFDKIEVRIMCKFLIEIDFFKIYPITAVKDDSIIKPLIKYLLTVINIQKLDDLKRQNILIYCIEYFKNSLSNLITLPLTALHFNEFYPLIQYFCFEDNLETQKKKAQIFVIISSIYTYKMTRQTWLYNILCLKPMIINIEGKSENETLENLLQLNFQLTLFKNIILSESEIIKKDNWLIQQGFVFKGKQTKGIKIPINLVLKNFTLILSFKFIPFQNNDSQIVYPLFSMLSPGKNIQIGFAIEKREQQYKLLLTSNSHTYDTNIAIIPNYSYNFIITLNSSPLGPLKKLIKIKYNDEGYKEMTLGNCVLNNIDCFLGCLPLKRLNKELQVFQGEIGTVFFFKEVLNDLLIHYMFSFKGYYHSILYSMFKYDTSYLDKYSSIYIIRDKSYIMAKQSIRKQNSSLLKAMEFIVSPQAISNNGKKWFKMNKLFENPNMNTTSIENKMKVLSPLFENFAVFERKSTLFQFLQYDGFDYIILHFEYLYSLLSCSKLNCSLKIFDQLDKNIEIIVQLLFMIFIEIDIKLFYHEVKLVFCQLSRLMQKICKLQMKYKMNQTVFNLIITLVFRIKSERDDYKVKEENCLLTQYSELQKILMNLLLCLDLYDVNNLSTINILFQTLNKINFDNDVRGIYFTKLLQFCIIINTDNHSLLKQSVKNNFKIIIYSYLNKDKNIIILKHMIDFFIKQNSPEVSYFISKIVYVFHFDDFVIQELEKCFSLSTHLTQLLYTQRQTDKFATLLIQLSLSIKNASFYLLFPSLSKIYPLSLLIKNLIISIYTIYPNKHKLSICKNNDCWNLCPLIVNDMGNLQNILKGCSYLLKKSMKTSKKSKTTDSDFLNTYYIIYKFVSMQIELDSTNKLFLSLFDEKNNLCELLFINAIYHNIQIKDDLIHILLRSFPVHPRHFIFPFLHTMIDLNIINDVFIVIIKLLNKLIITYELTHTEQFVFNVYKFLILIDRIIVSQIPEYYFKDDQITKIYCSIVQLLIKTNVIYSPVFLFTKTTREPKTIMEIVFDLSLHNYINTYNELFLKEFNMFFIDSTQGNTKILPMDYLIDNLQAKHDMEFFNMSLLNYSSSEIQPNILLKQELKFCVYFLIKTFLLIKKVQKYEDNNMLNSLNQFGNRLCLDINILIQNNEIKQNDENIINSQYMFFIAQYFRFYSQNEICNKLKVFYIDFLQQQKKQGKKIHMLDFKTIKNKNNKTFFNDTFAFSFFMPQVVNGINNKQFKISLYNENHIVYPSSTKTLLHIKFSIHFTDIFFYNQKFVNLKESYGALYKINLNTKLLNFPSKQKNFSNGILPPLFLKQDFRFFLNPFFNITHPYYKNNVSNINQNRISFIKPIIQLNQYEQLLNCELITIKYTLIGNMIMTDISLCFETSNKQFDEVNDIQYIFLSPLSERNFNKKKQIFLFFADIREIIIKRYYLMWQAAELFTKTGKSYFFNLLNQTNCHLFFSLIKKYSPSTKLIENSINEFFSNKYLHNWINNKINSMEYLLLINKYSSRTFNDIHQYPVMPWVILNYDYINNNKKYIYRKLDLPISYQSTKRFELVLDESLEKTFEKYVGGNFSTKDFVEYFLLRKSPFIHHVIISQGKRLDIQERVFVSFQSTLKNIISTNDNRELIPELFISSESLINLNCIYLGKTQRNQQIDDVSINNDNNQFNDSLSSYISVIFNHQKSLNSPKIANMLPNWINLYFGYKQENLCDKFQVCSKYSFEGNARLTERLEKYIKGKTTITQCIIKIKEKEQLIFNLGQTPSRLFQIIHPNMAMKQLHSNQTVTIKECQFENSKSDFLLKNNKEIIDLNINENNTLIYTLNKANKFNIYELKGLKHIQSIICHKLQLLQKDSFITEIIDHKHNKQNVSSFFYRYKPRYSSIVIWESEIIISCRYLDKSYKLYSFKGKVLKKVLTDEFINCLSYMKENVFLSGSENGRLIEWEIIFKADNFQNNISKSNDLNIKVIQRKTIITHDSSINAIVVSNYLGIIGTAGNDNWIYIRKVEDFELLTPIYIKEMNIIVVDLFISPLNLLYALCYDQNSNLFQIRGYTLTGMIFATSALDLFNNVEFSRNGNLIVGYFDKNLFGLLSASNLNLIKGKKIESKDNSFTKYNTFKSTKDNTKLIFGDNNGKIHIVVCKN